jgi:phosphoglycolate phosphatase
LFDLDGTLTDSAPSVLAAIRTTMAELGRPLEKDHDLAWVVGPPLRDIFARLLHPFGDTRVGLAMEYYVAHYDNGGFADADVFPAIPAALAAFRDDGWRLFVATSKSSTVAHRLLGHFGLDRWFATIYGHAEDGSLAHKPELIAHILRREGLDRARTIMIGDRSFDVAGAHANEVRAIGALWGYGGEAELTQAGADALATDPSDLLALAHGLLR